MIFRCTFQNLYRFHIAFEHDGDYHLTDPYLRQKDLAKNKYCEQLGIVLIRIPQLFQRVKIDDLIPFIQDQLAENGKPINIISPLLELNDSVYKYILKEDGFMIEKKLNEFNEVMQELTEYRIIRTKSFVSGFRTDFMVTVVENQSQRQKSFRYSNNEDTSCDKSAHFIKSKVLRVLFGWSRTKYKSRTFLLYLRSMIAL